MEYYDINSRKKKFSKIYLYINPQNKSYGVYSEETDKKTPQEKHADWSITTKMLEMKILLLYTGPQNKSCGVSSEDPR